MNATDVVSAVVLGELDDHLDELLRVVAMRREVVRGADRDRPPPRTPQMAERGEHWIYGSTIPPGWQLWRVNAQGRPGAADEQGDGSQPGGPTQGAPPCSTSPPSP